MLRSIPPGDLFFWEKPLRSPDQMNSLEKCIEKMNLIYVNSMLNHSKLTSFQQQLLCSLLMLLDLALLIDSIIRVQSVQVHRGL